MQDRVISKFIWQIIYLLSPLNQEIVSACRTSSSTEINSPAMGNFGRMVLHTGAGFFLLYQMHEVKELPPLLFTTAEKECSAGHSALQIDALEV